MENNYLSPKQALAFEKELSTCQPGNNSCTAGVIKKYLEISNKEQERIKAECEASGIVCAGVEELWRAETNDLGQKHWYLSNDQIMKNPDAITIAIAKYLNEHDLAYMNGQISGLDQVLYSGLDNWYLLPFGAAALKGGGVPAALEGSISIPVAKQVIIGSTISGGANIGIQYGLTGEINWTDAGIATFVGGVTGGAGGGWRVTVGANAVGGSVSAGIKGG